MRHFRVARNGLICIAVLLAALVIWDAGVSIYAFSVARKAADSGAALQALLQRKDFLAIPQKVAEAKEDAQKLKNVFDRLVVAPHLPILGPRVHQIETMTNALVFTTSGLSSLTRVGTTVAMPFLKTGQHPVSDTARHQLIAALQASIPEIDQAARAFANAESLLIRVPANAWVRSFPPTRHAYEAVLGITSFFHDMEPLLTMGTRLAGFEGERTYLLLLQNDTELRPTGGFIGTYGILRVKDGKILTFYTDDTYNLDRAANPASRPALPIPPAPFPLPQHLSQPYWYLRDVNWSPDFPETAVRALDFYRQEGGTEAPNGVIAINTRPMQALLAITGPIEANHQKFTSENLVDTLQSAVEQDLYQRGIAVDERKVIVNTLSQALLAKLETLSPAKWQDVLHLVRSSLDEKNILIYDVDPRAQGEIVRRSWAGELKQTSNDYLMVVDANLASLKTDPAVDRAITYALSEEPTGSLVADLTVTYDHHGTFNWKTTRLRNYVRVYVPKGSVLLASDGAMVREKSALPGTVLQTEEHGRTVFGAFIIIEPGEKKTLHLKYRLPRSVMTMRANENQYNLYIQKQPGAASHDLRVSGPPVATSEWHPSTISVIHQANGLVQWNTKLARDEQFSLVFPRK